MADSQTIDKLAIEISSSVTGQSKIDKFAKSLDGLADSARRIDTKKLQSAARNVRTFSDSLSGIDTNRIKNFTNSLSRLSEIKADNLKNLDKLSSQIHSLASLNDSVKGITSLVSALSRLSNAKMGNFDTGKFEAITNGITTFSRSLAGVEGIDSNVVKLVTAVSKLADTGNKIGTVSTELPKLGNSLSVLIKDLQGVGAIDSSITNLVSGIANLSRAGDTAAKTTANLDKFGDAVVRLVNKIKGVGDVNANLANTIQGLGNLAQSGVKFGSVAQTTNTQTVKLGDGFKRLGSVVKNVLNPFNSLRDKLGMTHKTSRSLASSVGLLYAKFWMLMRLIRGVGKVVKSAQDYMEAFNYLNVALQKVGEDSKDQFKRFGYDNAEAYQKSFEDRYTALQKQMTGYNVDSKTGDLSYNMGKSLGLNLTDVMQYQAQITQITNSTGQLGEVSVMAGKALSMLAADFSSLTNTDMKTVQENLVSGMNGMVRSVYKYGINITSASLQQIAYNHGITESVAKLSMATKQQLRLIGILEQSRVAYGDLAKTMNTPANQLRLLQAGFSNLGRTIGGLFLPALQTIYPVLNGIVMVLQEFFGWLAKIMGIKLPDMSSALAMPDIETPAEDAGDLADNTGRAAKNAKKLNDNLQGFDEINKLQKNDNGSGSGGAGGLGGIGDYDLSNDLSKLMKRYQKIWDKMFNSSENKAYKWAKRMKEALLRGWKNGGDFTFLGMELGQALSEKLANVPWDKIQAGVNKVVRSFATFLNGVVKGTNWKTVGETIANAFNTIVDALYTWHETFDFLEFGKGLAKGLNALISKFNFAKFGAMLGKKLRNMVQLAFGFITNVDFKKLGKQITSAINNFLNKMGEVDPRTGLSGWAELGKTISDGIKGLLDTIIEVLDGADWDAVGKAIADFLGQIDWLGIFGKLGVAIVKALWGAIKAAFTAFTSDPVGVGGSIVAILGGLFAFNKLKGLVGIIKGGIGKVFGIGLKQGVASGVAEAGISGAAGSVAGGGILSKLKGFGGKAANFFKTGFLSNLKGLAKAIGSKLGSILTKVGWAGVAASAVALIEKEIERSEAHDENIEAHKNTGAMQAVEAYAVGGANGKSNYETRKEELDKAQQELAALEERRKNLKFNISAGDFANPFNVIGNAQAIENYKTDLELVEAEYAKINERVAKLNSLYDEERKKQIALQEARSQKGAEAVVERLRKMAEKGKITWHEYSIAVNKARNTIEKFENTTARGKKDRLGRAISSTERYQKAVRELAGELDKAKVPTEQQKAILDKLKDALMEGRISMKEYEDIVKNSRGSVQKLTQAINEIPANKKMRLNAKLNGIRNIKKELQDLMNKKYEIHVNTVYDRSDNEVRVDKLANALGGYQKWDIYKSKGAYITGKTIHIPKELDISWIKDAIKKYKLKGIKIEKFAQGGFIEDGLFTMNKHEIAGKLNNGKSVVANNDMIIESLAKGLTPAMYSAIKQGINDANNGNNNAPIKVYLDGKQLADSAVKYMRQSGRNNGRGALAY